MRIIDPGSGVGETGSELRSITGAPPLAPAPITELFWSAVAIPGDAEAETSAGNSGNIGAAIVIGCVGCAFVSLGSGFVSAGCGFAGTGCAFGIPGCVLGGVTDDDGGFGEGEDELWSEASLPFGTEAEVDCAVLFDWRALPTGEAPVHPAPSRATPLICPLPVDPPRNVASERGLHKGASLSIATLEP